MAGFYDSIDLKWTRSGDFSIGEGDLADTSDDTLTSLVQEIQTVCKSSLGEWEMWPGIGSNLGEFIGEPNIKDTANLIHDRLRLAIVSQGLVNDEDLDITIIPTHRTEIAIIIRVSALPTPYNSLRDNELISINFVFDFAEFGLLPLREPLTPPNKEVR